MKKHLLPLILGLAGVFAIATAFGMGDELLDEPEDDGVVLGEEDLAERGEILRNQFRRMTPGDEPLVQDIGTWPAAWEEFGTNWDSAAADREYGAWVVPVELTQENGATVMKDGEGNELWRGTTDFARPESADVVLTGGLVAEEDWAVYEGVRGAVEEMTADASRVDIPVPMRSHPTNGLRFTSCAWTTNDGFHMELAYEVDTNVDLFVYAVAHTSALVVATWTNDENVAITDTNTVWYSVGEPFNGRDSTWEYLDTVAIDNGVAEYEDSGFPAGLGRLRYYAGAVAQDSDGDGLSDGQEAFISHSDPMNTDTDGDGVLDGADTHPNKSNVWWIVKTTNAWYYQEFLGDCTLNAPRQSNAIWNVVGDAPTSDSVVSNVCLNGDVDDLITVDWIDVDSDRGPTNYVNRSIRGLMLSPTSQVFRLQLFDYPAEDYYGPNEVRLGHSLWDPFKVEWEWMIPIDIRMEPIWTSETLPLDNPSGIILGSNAWFHVDVFPEGVVPEEQIVWEAQGGKLEFVTTNTGSRVEVCATNTGDATLSVEVQGTVGDFGLPPFHVKVMPLTVVTARVGIVVTTNGEWVVSSNRVQQIVDEANQVLLQAGIQLKCEPPIPINDVLGYENIIVGSLEHNILIGSLPAQGKLEIYFVGSITHGLGMADGSYNPNGILIATNGTGRVLGHEVCHAFGLRDIYLRWQDVDLVMTGPAQENWMPCDWGNYRTETSNIPVDVEFVIPRLLMFGKSRADKGDIASGTVYGLTCEGPVSNITWSLEHQAVGLSGMTNSPVH